MTDRPATRDRPLVWLSAVTWRFPLIGRTRMLTEAWRAAGREVTFVQVPSLRTGVERLASVGPATQDESHVVRPWPAPAYGRWEALGAAGLTRRVAKRARELRGRLERRLDLGRSVALVVSPAWVPWLGELPFGHVVYDCIDHVDVHVPRPRLAALFQDWEHELIRIASAVVTTAEPLAERVRQDRSDVAVHVIRNGVDASAFRCAASTSPRPSDLPPASSRPLVGFVGALYDWVDVELIEAVARSRPGMDFVFVGPIGRGVRLPALPNVLALGHRPYAEVPAYIEACEACWLPFRGGAISSTANPIKIYEYLALGKRVLSTGVADRHVFGDLVDFREGAEELARGLDIATSAPPHDVARRRSFAEANSWSARAREFTEFVDQVVGVPA